MSANTNTVVSSTEQTKKRVYKKKEVVVEAVVSTPVEEVDVPTVTDETVEEEVLTKVDEKDDKKSSVVNRESVMASFEELIASVDGEIGALRASDNKSKSVPFLRKVVAHLKKLQKHTARIAKGGKIRKTGASTTSGFLKPVPVSDEIRKFAGWEKDELHSRVDVTNFICQHIKKNNLQKADDRRQIAPDATLKKILNIKKDSKDTIPYYEIQKHIKHHFPKPPAPLAVVS
jgi:chromatin remodeling complex protein RSC6